MSPLRCRVSQNFFIAGLISALAALLGAHPSSPFLQGVSLMRFSVREAVHCRARSPGTLQPLLLMRTPRAASLIGSLLHFSEPL